MAATKKNGTIIVKVALVNYMHPYSGIGKYSFNLFRTFRKQRKNVRMYYLETRHNKLPGQPGITKIRKDTPFFELNKTVIPYFYFPTKIPDGCDVYHGTSQFLAKLAHYRKPTVITHHDIRPILIAHDLKMRAVGMAVKHLLNFYKEADKIITVSERGKEILSGLKIVPDDKIVPINHGFDPKIYRPIPKSLARRKLGLPQDARIILNIGAEEPMKKVPLVMESVRRVQKVEPNLLFVRVGGGVQSGGYWKAREDLKKKLRIKHFRNVPETEMPYIYSSADVFISPNVYDEGFNYPPLEAMACGVPIMTSNMKIFEKWGLQIPSNPRDLAESILKVINNKSLSRRLSKKSLKGSKEFSLEKEARATYRVYEEVSRR